MGVVGGDDGQIVDPLVRPQRRLLPDQGLPVGRAPREEQLAGRLQRPLRVAPQGAGCQLGRVVDQDGPPVWPPEEVGRAAAADHPHPQFAGASRRPPKILALAA